MTNSQKEKKPSQSLLRNY